MTEKKEYEVDIKYKLTEIKCKNCEFRKNNSCDNEEVYKLLTLEPANKLVQLNFNRNFGCIFWKVDNK